MMAVYYFGSRVRSDRDLRESRQKSMDHVRSSRCIVLHAHACAVLYLVVVADQCNASSYMAAMLASACTIHVSLDR